MEICKKCLIEKDKSEFYSRAKRKNSYCKTCFNEYCVNRWRQRKIDAVNHKGGKCIHCGYSKNHSALDFHHRDPDEKDVEWTKLRLRSWASILKELEKCDLVCRNCHAEIHNPQSTQ